MESPQSDKKLQNLGCVRVLGIVWFQEDLKVWGIVWNLRMKLNNIFEGLTFLL